MPYSEKEIQSIKEMESLVSDFDNNIDAIKSFFKDKEIDVSLGTQYIYADTARQRRMLLFDIMLHESKNLQSDWKTAYHLLKEAYIMTDNIYAQLKLSPYGFNLKDYLRGMRERIDINVLMEDEERDYLNSLTFPLTVYRGMCNKEYDSRNFGISWTANIDTAKRYVFYSKNENHEPSGKIANKSVSREDIFAAWGVIGEEKELIIIYPN